MYYTEQQASLVMHFGEMGSRWGFNRTIGQLLALLMLQPEAVTANELAEALHISRGNVSMGLKELQSWNLVQVQHVPGDRKDYYSAQGSVWDMAKTVFEERRKREIDPTLSVLRSNLLTDPTTPEDTYVHARIGEMHDLLELLTQWSGSLNTMSPDTLQSLMKLGSGVAKVLDLKERVIGKK